MSTTKLIGERLITAAQNVLSARRPTISASTRFRAAAVHAADRTWPADYVAA